MHAAIQPIMAWFKGEQAMTLQMIKAIPADKLNTKVHDKFRTAAELAAHIADAISDLVKSFEAGKPVFTMNSEVPKSIAEMAQKYESASNAFLAAAEKFTEAQLFKNYPFEMNGQVMWNPAGIEFISGYICHEIHHRGQLGLMVRMLDGKVPGVYGPSGDDMPM